ncbi:hypothetical protein ABA45_14995 [Marinobacter psychrophilus]|uniref:Uncharacterized protein n=1 Tax=Marinobacter psychrophilus TaxID=330734 RepID=A0A0H4I731_9GAMM|nr:hypothetical protein ABA45_14995 [Marinobacter psychrophilus]
MEVLSRFVKRASLALHEPQDSSEKQYIAELLAEFYVFKTSTLLAEWDHGTLMIGVILSTRYLLNWITNFIHEEKATP